jgi:6-phosphofructokinase
MNTEQRRLGILVGGGPAPGINSAISAATIEAVNTGFEVLGFYDGFEHLVNGRTDMMRPLAIADVSRIHAQGGSILRTSRANPTRRPEDLERAIQALHQLGVAHLVTIGGDDTAFAAFEVAKAAKGALRVAHLPKTIDNDLPLPAAMPTFGFETARHVGTASALNLMEDSRTTNRWFYAVVMGRLAGHLALGIGKSAGATLTIIPEEFPNERISLNTVCSMLEAAILKRRLMGRKDGLAIIAEGVGEKLDPEELAKIPGVQVGYDPYGHVTLGDIPLASILKREVQRRFAARRERMPIVGVTLGYEMRCAPPIPFDIDYTRTLGYGAVRFLLSEPAEEDLCYGGLVCLEEGYLRALPFENFRDPATGRTRVRLVDLQSEHYKVAHDYMIRLEQRDLEDPDVRAKLAEVANMEPEELDSLFAAGRVNDQQIAA